MKILVTGATGFVGNHFVKALKDSAYDVRVLVRPHVRRSVTLPWLNEECVEIVWGDVTNVADVEKAVRAVDAVFHLAALLGGWNIPEKEYYNVNVFGTQILVEQCLKHHTGHFVFLSTTGVMGRLKVIPADIDDPCCPVSHYERSKYQAESIVRDAIEKRNFHATIIRPTHVYGPGDKNTVELFKVIKSLKFFPLISGGHNLFQPIYVKDLVQAFNLCIEKRDVTAKKSYIIAGNEKITFKRFVHLSAEILNNRVMTLNIPTHLAWVLSSINENFGMILNWEPPLTRSRVEFFTRDHVFSVRKIQEDVGFAPKIDIKTGLNETIRWYEENGWL